jgi:hypothetical protein
MKNSNFTKEVEQELAENKRFQLEHNLNSLNLQSHSNMEAAIARGIKLLHKDSLRIKTKTEHKPDVPKSSSYIWIAEEVTSMGYYYK